MLDRTDQVVQGLARALWLCAYADMANEDETLRRPPPGGDWEAVTPATPERAFELAFEMLGVFKAANGMEVEALIEKAFAANGIQDNQEERRLFGHYLGMNMLGDGVSWEDSHEDVGLVYPEYCGGSVQCDLEDDFRDREGLLDHD